MLLVVQQQLTMAQISQISGFLLSANLSPPATPSCGLPCHRQAFGVAAMSHCLVPRVGGTTDSFLARVPWGPAPGIVQHASSIVPPLPYAHLCDPSHTSPGLFRSSCLGPARAVSVCLVVLCPSEHLRLNRLCCFRQLLRQSACSRLETPSTVEPDWHLGRVMRGNRMRGKKRNLEPLGPPEGECAWSH